MTTLLLYVLIFSTAVYSLVQPWIGVIAYYTLAIMFPQAIWPWIFQDLRVSFIVSISVIAGFLIAGISNRVDFSFLKDWMNLMVALLWMFIVLSYFFGAYGISQTESGITNSKLLVTHINKVFLFYFISVLLIDSREKLHCLVIVMLVTICYYTYWGNERYFSGLMGMMGVYRLNGPGGVYGDENAFGMLFVMGVPFLYFMGGWYRNKLFKYLLWLLIPMAWHAIFLTGSRGALVGVGVVSLFIALRSRKKSVGIAFVIALLVAFAWQGGDYLKDRSRTIVEYEGERSAEGRLQAWRAGIKMILDHPVTGVGPGNFMTAFPDYSYERVRVSHNTFFQLASESGIAAGVIYVLLCTGILRRGMKNSRILKGKDQLLWAINEAVICSSSGYFVCAMFLNLATYETFYYLLILTVVQKKMIANQSEVLDTESFILHRD